MLDGGIDCSAARALYLGGRGGGTVASMAAELAGMAGAGGAGGPDFCYQSPGVPTPPIFRRPGVTDSSGGGDDMARSHDAGRPTGFTLIEILIVVMLLGIMAAVVFPAFTNHSRQARQSTLVSSVHSVRSLIQAYRIQHGDELPDLAAASGGGNHFEPLLIVTVYRGQNRGPYLQGVPVNPLTGGSNVLNATTFTINGVPDPVPGADFIYDFTNDSGLLWGTSDRATGTPVVQ